MKNFLLAVFFLSLIFGGLFTISCYKKGPVILLNQNNITKFGINVVDYYQGNSDYAVVLIPNVHNSFECQAQVYKTLESVMYKSKFVAREWVGFNNDRLIGSFHWGFSGPIYSRTKENSTMRNVLTEVEKFVKLTRNTRIKMVNKWIETNQFPEGTNINFPIKAPYLLEAVYQDEVKSFGVGDAETNRRAAIAVAARMQGMISFDKFVSEILEPRNESFVKNIQSIVERGGQGFLVPFSVGTYHIPGLKKLLKNKNRSYIVIENGACKVK